MAADSSLKKQPQVKLLINRKLEAMASQILPQRQAQIMVVDAQKSITVKLEPRDLKEPQEKQQRDLKKQQQEAELEAEIKMEAVSEDEFEVSTDEEEEEEQQQKQEQGDVLDPEVKQEILGVLEEESIDGDLDVVDNSEEEEEEEQEQRELTTLEGMTIETKGQYSKCPRCEKFIKATFILKHIKQHDLVPQVYKCTDGCSMTFNRVDNMFRHLRNVHKSKTPYVCRYCDQRFSQPKALRCHLASHKEKQQEMREPLLPQEIPLVTFACEFPGCDKVYGKRHHLKEHERKHTGDMRFPCEVCGKKFYIQSHRKMHLYSHTGVKPHVCRWKCGLTFASYGGRMKHERITHYDENPLKSECDVCARPFSNQQQLVKHRMTHLNPSERLDYRCSFCHIMLDTIKLKERHEERHRDGETFACEVCKKSFKNEKNLGHHLKNNHLSPDDKKVKPGKKAKSGQNTNLIPCHLCNPPKMFCITSLRRHLARIHSTNYKCKQCGKGFQDEARYNMHIDIHRNRECHLCGKTFKRKQNADIHMMGVHQLTTADLEKMGRWNPRSDHQKECPDYMRRSLPKYKLFKDDTCEEIDIKEEPITDDF